jgi:hypothetical protein
MKTIKKIGDIVSTLLIAFGISVLFWMMLMYGCTETHSVAECQDNSYSRIMLSVVDLFR